METIDRSKIAFRKSSFSPDAGSCVEVGMHEELIYVRDSKDTDGPVLVFNQVEWEAFLKGMKAGEFDLTP